MDMLFAIGIIYWFFFTSESPLPEVNVASIFGMRLSQSAFGDLSTEMKSIAWNTLVTSSSSSTLLMHSGFSSDTFLYVADFISPFSSLTVIFIVFGLGVGSILMISIDNPPIVVDCRGCGFRVPQNIQ